MCLHAACALHVQEEELKAVKDKAVEAETRASEAEIRVKEAKVGVGMGVLCGGCVSSVGLGACLKWLNVRSVFAPRSRVQLPGNSTMCCLDTVFSATCCLSCVVCCCVGSAGGA